MSSHASVAHKWASRKKLSGKSGNISFIGDTIYSYHWWPMAKWHTATDGTAYVIMVDKPYGNSTAKHISCVRRAIPNDVLVYYSSSYDTAYFSSRRTPRLEPDTVLPYMLERITDAYNNAFNMRLYSSERSRMPEQWMEETESIKARAMKFCAMTGLPWLDDIDKYVISSYELRLLKRMVEPIEAKVQERIKNREEKERQIDEAYIDALSRYGLSYIEAAKAWMRKEKVCGYGGFMNATINVPHSHPYYKLTKKDKLTQTMATAMRIEDNYVVTNRHASVPVESARRLWNIMKANRPVHGELVGDYTVRSWNGELVIGCHHIPREIVEYFVELNNW
jgi:hypothetical protein